jgi:hypothetical protein
VHVIGQTVPCFITGGGFEQSYKAAVDTDTMLVVATGLSQAANDKQQITADGGEVPCPRHWAR